jgi:hypothetical protein
MKRREQIDEVFLEALRSATAQRGEEVIMGDIVAHASDVANESVIDPPRLHRFGNTLLRSVGYKGFSYKPDLGDLFFFSIERLRRKGAIESRQDPLHFDLHGETARLLYRLADRPGE